MEAGVEGWWARTSSLRVWLMTARKWCTEEREVSGSKGLMVWHCGTSVACNSLNERRGERRRLVALRGNSMAKDVQLAYCFFRSSPITREIIPGRSLH
jgi:hypothetical protein